MLHSDKQLIAGNLSTQYHQSMIESFQMEDNGT